MWEGGLEQRVKSKTVSSCTRDDSFWLVSFFCILVQYPNGNWLQDPICILPDPTGILLCASWCNISLASQYTISPESQYSTPYISWYNISLKSHYKIPPISCLHPAVGSQPYSAVYDLAHTPVCYLAHSSVRYLTYILLKDLAYILLPAFQCDNPYIV